MHVAFVGFGLIGGSIARAIRAGGTSRAWTLRAWSPSGVGSARAVAEGVLDAAATTPEAAIAGADLVVLAGPPTACLDGLESLAGPWREALGPATVITDVASTKASLVGRADTLGLRFVGGHPMAGLERSGYGAGRADLFVDRPWVIVPGAHASDEDIGRVEELAGACGSRPVRLGPDAHDLAVAGISHLPLIVAAALVEAVAGRPDATAPGWATAGPLAASGWRDMTRLARGDPAMGAGIAATNRVALSARIRDLEAILADWRSSLEDGTDEAELRARLEAARARLGEAP